MIDNMYTVMKRINELRGRFGLNRRHDAGAAWPCALWPCLPAGPLTASSKGSLR